MSNGVLIKDRVDESLKHMRRVGLSWVNSTNHNNIILRVRLLMTDIDQWNIKSTKTLAET